MKTDTVTETSPEITRVFAPVVVPVRADVPQDIEMGHEDEEYDEESWDLDEYEELCESTYDIRELVTIFATLLCIGTGISCVQEKEYMHAIISAHLSVLSYFSYAFPKVSFIHNPSVLFFPILPIIGSGSGWVFGMMLYTADLMDTIKSKHIAQIIRVTFGVIFTYITLIAEVPSIYIIAILFCTIPPKLARWLMITIVWCLWTNEAIMKNILSLSISDDPLQPFI